MSINKPWKENNLLLNEKIKIDEFSVEDSKIFSPTIKYVKERYKEFNKKYFENKLIDIDRLTTKIVAENRYGGLTQIYVYSGGSQPFSFQISRYYQRPEKYYCEVILHEMIHVYQSFVLNMTKLPHDETFTDKMNEINSYGWNVQTSGIRTKTDTMYPSVKQSLERSIFVSIKLKDGSNATFIIDKNEMPAIYSNFSNYQFYNIIDSDEFKLYDRYSDVNYALRSSVPFTYTKSTDEELKQMVKDYKIKPIKESSNKYQLYDIKLTENERNTLIKDEGYDEFGNYFSISNPVNINGKKVTIVSAE